MVAPWRRDFEVLEILVRVPITRRVECGYCRKAISKHCNWWHTSLVMSHNIGGMGSNTVKVTAMK